MHRIPKRSVIKVSDRGCGVVLHVGSRLLADLADRSGVTGGFGEVPDGLRERRSGHAPERVLVDLAAAAVDLAVAGAAGAGRVPVRPGDL